MSQDRNGNLWVGTINDCLRKQSVGTTKFIKNIDIPQYANVVTVTQDKNVNLWVSTNHGL